MRALDAALRLVALALRVRQFFATGGETGLRSAHVLFAGREFDAQLLDALFALEHAGMRIATAIYAQPVPPYPLAGPGDDGFVVRELAAQLQGGRKRFGKAH